MKLKYKSFTYRISTFLLGIFGIFDDLIFSVHFIKMENQAPRKFRLRRLQPFSPHNDAKLDESVIKKNLEPLIQNVEKKKRAQEMYYETHADLMGASPLTRDLDKKPVKQRLGRRMPFTGTNTAAIPPKRRLRRLVGGTANNQINKKKSRNFSAQHRLNLIRARHQASTMSPNTPKKFRLRRLLPNNLSSTPKNFKVQVRNNTFLDKQHFVQGFHRFKQVLDGTIQLEIKRIQIAFQGGQTLVPTAVRPVTTTLSMNERFALLS